MQIDLETSSSQSREYSGKASKKVDGGLARKNSEGYGSRDEVVSPKSPTAGFYVQNRNLYWTTKVVIVCLMMSCVYLGKKYGTPSVEVKNLSDPVHDATEYLNNMINTNKSFAMFFQISASLIMDFSFFALCIYWALRINTGRVLYAMACFYIFRGINQALVILPFPDGYYWEYPSFPAYVTPYGRTSDFFYSGHVGFLNLVALEWLQHKKKFMFKLTWFFNIYIAFVMIICRIHYAVDITTGLVVSHWLFMIVQQHAHKLDNVFKNLYRKAEPLLNPKSGGASDDISGEEIDVQP